MCPESCAWEGNVRDCCSCVRFFFLAEYEREKGARRGAVTTAGKICDCASVLASVLVWHMAVDGRWGIYFTLASVSGGRRRSGERVRQQMTEQARAFRPETREQTKGRRERVTGELLRALRRK
ncbi:hypothetical protein TcCL_NonESM02546 [Trypanosoma cruzi]|nr:hypothetical protein TcCL_NonESM02546 [Trypanosoma cruzi]